MIKENYFSKEICIHHKGMIPYVAYYIVKGGLKLLKKKGVEIEATKGEIIGLEEVWNDKPLNYKILTMPGTIILYFDKSLLSTLKNCF